MLFRKRHDTNYRDLKEAPVPEGQHLLEVDDLKMYFHTQDGVVKAVNGVSYSSFPIWARVSLIMVLLRLMVRPGHHAVPGQARLLLHGGPRRLLRRQVVRPRPPGHRLRLLRDSGPLPSPLRRDRSYSAPRSVRPPAAETRRAGRAGSARHQRRLLHVPAGRSDAGTSRSPA